MASPPSLSKRVCSDFYFLEQIGEGSYSSVHRCEDKKTGKTYAIKKVSKVLLIKECKQKYAFREKQVLTILSDYHYFSQLFFTFQDESYLYYGMSYHSNKDLLELITKHKRLSLECVRFYGAELTDAILHMHSRLIIHRDIKPENIMLDNNYHIKIIDFGSCRILNDDDQRRHSMVGTPQFMAPEVIHGGEVGVECDLWSFGCVLFQMYSGNHLFKGDHNYDILRKVSSGKFELPLEMDVNLKDLISNLVVINASDRLKPDQLRNHLMFKDIEWEKLFSQSPPHFPL